MRKLFIMALLLAILPAQAQTISEQEAQKIAESFYAQSEQSKPTGANTTVSVSLAYQKDAALYVFNNPEETGFVIVSGSGQVENPILGWSDNGPFNYDTAPCGLKALLNSLTPDPSPKGEGRDMIQAVNTADKHTTPLSLGEGSGVRPKFRF